MDCSVVVSVCVPTYNQEKEIRQTLDGILAQEFDNYEIIIANDASTDGTDEVCREYIRKYPGKIKYILQENNKGIIGNTKDCLLAAQGKYIAICEGDDYWIDTLKLSKQVDILDKRQDVSMVHTAWINYETESEIFTNAPIDNRSFCCETKHGQECFEEIIMQKYRGIRFSSVLFRNDLFKFILKKHPYFFSNDYTTLDINVFYTMAYYGKLHYLPEYTTVYRVHDGSVSINTDENKSARYTFGVLVAKAYFCKIFETSNEIKDNIFRKSLEGLSPFVLKHGDLTMAAKITNLAKEHGYKLRIGQKLCLFGARNKLFKSLILRIIHLKS